MTELNVAVDVPSVILAYYGPCLSMNMLLKWLLVCVIVGDSFICCYDNDLS